MSSNAKFLCAGVLLATFMVVGHFRAGSKEVKPLQFSSVSPERMKGVQTREQSTSDLNVDPEREVARESLAVAPLSVADPLAALAVEIPEQASNTVSSTSDKELNPYSSLSSENMFAALPAKDYENFETSGMEFYLDATTSISQGEKGELNKVLEEDPYAQALQAEVVEEQVREETPSYLEQVTKISEVQ